ncbi:MAG: fibronectin type III domain-containing protein [Verrucomicrobia bacterium]|nr:fibronectin type III domain-containing protein [Verrucomicrobiota bacterium]
MRRIVLSTFLLSTLAIFSPFPATAARNVTLAWDASASPSVVGYRVYHGVASRNYTNQVSAGNTTSGTLSNLVEGTTYFIAATAVNDLGVESEFSDELSYTVPAVQSPNQPPTLDQPADITINQSAPAQAIDLSGITSGSQNESQTLVVSATSSNPSLIPHPTVNYTSPNTAGQLTVQPVSNQSGTAIVTVTVDDGGTNNNLVVRAFTVAVTDSNTRPTLDSISNRTINENAGEQTVNLAGISSGSANELQPLTVTASSSNPALVPHPSVDYTSPDAVGTLIFEPVTYAYGTATITVTVSDGGTVNSTRSRSFTVTVRSVNQPPTLDPVGDTVVAGGTEAIGSRVVVLSGITSGAPNENQTLIVSALSGNPALIPHPSVNYQSPNTSGTLSLAPVAGQFGSTTVTVTVNDGGSSNNIVTQVFTVKVVSPNDPPTLDPLVNLSLTENAGVQNVNLSGITSGLPDGLAALTVTAESSNPDLIPHPIVTYSSPNPTGSLNFVPATDGYGSAVITVTVNNGQAYNNTFSRSFWVTIDSDVAQLSLGSTELRAGQTGSVALNFSSSEGVASLNLVLDVPPGRLSNFSLQALASEIDPASTSVVALPNSSVVIQLATRSGQTLLGSKEVAQLSFSTIANQQSAFVPLRVRPFSATKSDGTFIADRPAEPGRAVIIAQEALLEAAFNTDGSRRLMLFGKPASTYAIEYSTNPTAAGSWVRLPAGVTLNTLSAAVPGIDATATQVFFRTVELIAGP